MENIRQYIFTLMAMAILCGLVPEFFENNSVLKKLITFSAGILMMIVVANPLLRMDSIQLNWTPDNLEQEVQDALISGEEQANDMLRQIITEQTQAYILDKAATMGTELTAQVTLSDTEPPTPKSVLLTGTASPYLRRQLTKVLVSDLAISEDNVQWNY